MTRQVHYDESDWPLVVVTMPPGPVTGDALEAHLEVIEGFFRRGAPFGIVFDLRRAGMPTASDRRQIATRMQADAETYPGLLAGCAVVIDSFLQRRAVQTIHWMLDSGYPIETFPEIDAAKTWLHTRFAPTPAFAR